MVRASLRFALGFLASILLLACGDDGAPLDSGAPPVDSALPDTAPVDARLPDVGAPPPCSTAATLVRALPGYGDGTTEAPTGFASAAGRFAFSFPRFDPAGSAVGLGVVDAEGATVTDATLERADGTVARVADTTVGVLGGSFFALWTRADLDASGVVRGVRIRDAVIADTGEELRAAADLYTDAAAPVLSTDGEAGFLLRAELRLVSGTSVITPRLVRLDIGGDPVGVDVNLLSYLQPDARERRLALADTGPTLLEWVPPSQLYSVAFTPEGGPSRTQRRVDGVAALDAVAATGERVLAVSTERAGGEGRVDATLLGRDGRPVTTLALARTVDVRPRAVAFVAWPGFVVVWREGAGDAAVLMAAGLDVDGNLRVPVQQVATVPGAEGPLWGASDTVSPEGGLALGFRVDDGSGSALGLVRACAPR